MPEYLTACVPDCKLSHHAFVNNPFNGKCEFCGNDCNSCNLKYGCELCPPDGQDVGMVNAIDSARDYYSSTFKKCQGNIYYGHTSATINNELITIAISNV